MFLLAGLRGGRFLPHVWLQNDIIRGRGASWLEIEDLVALSSVLLNSSPIFLNQMD